MKNHKVKWLLERLKGIEQASIQAASLKNIANYYTLYHIRRLLLDSFTALVSRFYSSTTTRQASLGRWYFVVFDIGEVHARYKTS